jgi:hypothetical protein
LPASPATRTVTGIVTSPPGATDTEPATSICTPELCACGASATVQVPEPLPASVSVSSIDFRCGPVETSIPWNDSDCGSVKIFGSSAAETFASPAPSRSTGASFVRAVSPQAAPAVDIRADLTWYADQPGCCSSRSAAAPAT